MVRRNGPVTPMPPKDICPVPPKPPISPLVSVKSVNGQTGDVVLKELTIGEKSYNGSDDVQIYAADLGLAKAFVYQGAKSTIARVLEDIETAEAGDVFFCKEDKLFYLSVGEGDSIQFTSIEALENAIGKAVEGLATEEWVEDQGYLTEHQDISFLATKEELAEVENEIPSLDGYATEQWVEDKHYLTEHQSLADYSLISETGNHLNLTIDTTDYKLTVELFNKNNELISTDFVDLPIESLVRRGWYDPKTKCIILELEGGGVINVPVSDLVEDLATQAEVDDIKAVIPADAAADNKLVTKDYADHNTGTITHITVNGTEQPIVEKTVEIGVPTATSELANDSDFINHTDLYMGDMLKAKYTIGGIMEGDEYVADTPVQDILKDMFMKTKPVTYTDVYFAAPLTIPDSVEGFDKLTVDDSFVNGSLEHEFTNVSNHYIAFAYDNRYGKLAHIYVNGLDAEAFDCIDFFQRTTVVVDEETPYYLYVTKELTTAGTDTYKFLWN